MSGAMGFGPREEKEATTGAAEFFITTLFNMFPCGFLKNKNLKPYKIDYHPKQLEVYSITRLLYYYHTSDTIENFRAILPFELSPILHIPLSF
jgi:hypothetical protein